MDEKIGEEKKDYSEKEIVKKKREIERLKQKVEKLEKEIEEKNKKKTEEKKYIRLLVFLIVLLVISDAIFLVVYFKPYNISLKEGGTDGEETEFKRCVDGTPEGSCSKNKPFFCYNGELLKNAIICGCPEGYKLDFQDCKKI